MPTNGLAVPFMKFMFEFQLYQEAQHIAETSPLGVLIIASRTSSSSTKMPYTQQQVQELHPENSPATMTSVARSDVAVCGSTKGREESPRAAGRDTLKTELSYSLQRWLQQSRNEEPWTALMDLQR